MMEIIKAPVINKFPELERHEPANIDSSAIMLFKFCPKAYFLRHVLGYTTKDEKIYFAFGRSYHKYREILEIEYKKFKATKSLELMIGTAMEGALKTWGNTRDLTPPDKFYWLTKARLIECMIMVGKHWINEKKLGKIEVLETEQPFNIVLPDGNTRSGRFDQIVLLNGRSIWGRDFKTTTKEMMFFDRGLKPNDQFIGYTYAQCKLSGQEVKGQLIEVLQNLRPTKTDPKPPKLEVRNVSFSKDEFDLWEREQAYWQILLKGCRDTDFYPKSEKGCSFCEFHAVCQSASESQELLVLKTNYKKEVWDNTYED